MSIRLIWVFFLCLLNNNLRTNSYLLTTIYFWLVLNTVYLFEFLYLIISIRTTLKILRKYNTLSNTLFLAKNKNLICYISTMANKSIISILFVEQLVFLK